MVSPQYKYDGLQKYYAKFDGTRCKLQIIKELKVREENIVGRIYICNISFVLFVPPKTDIKQS